MQMDLIGKAKFSLNKLILVNSAHHCFTETDINRHVAIYGGNGKGKSSILNALKLFLLPEENFQKCEKKFAFSKGSGKGFYNKADSHSHYFTEDRSFVILEAENRSGKFCQVLFRHKNIMFGYARMLVPCGFDEIRHLFWNTACGGLGEAVAGLSLQGVLNALATMGGKSISNTAEIKKRLFTEHEYEREADRYCTLPFKQGGSEKEINAFRNLFQLAYDIGAQDERTLPNAVAAILEGEKQHERELVDVDLEKIIQEEEALRAEEEYLDLCASQQDNWLELERLHNEFQKQQPAVAQAYGSFNRTLAEAVERAESEQRIRGLQEQRLRESVGCLKKRLQDLEENRKKTQWEIENLRKNREGLHKQLEQTETVLQRYGGSIEAAQEDLLAQKERLKTHAGNLKDQETAAKNLQGAVRYRNIVQEELVAARRRLDNDEETLPDFLRNSHSRNILFALNANLAKLRTKPDEAAEQAIDEFAGLFSNDDGRLAFLSEPVPNTPFSAYRREQQRELLQRDLEEIQQRFNEADHRVTELNRACTGGTENLAAEQKRVQERQRQAERDFVSVVNYKEDKQRLLDNIAALKTAEDAENELGRQCEEVRAQSEQADAEYDAHREAAKAAEDAYRDYPDFQHRLKSLILDYGHLLENTVPLRNESAIIGRTELENIERACRDCHNLEKRRNGLMAKLSNGRESVLRNEQYSELAYIDETIDGQVFDDCYRSLHSIYAALENDRQMLSDRIAAHIEESQISIQYLEDAERQIKAFESEINQEFRRHRISNLEEIRFRIELHPIFRRLLDEIREIDYAAGDFHDKRFYMLLSQFREQFFVKGRGYSRLNMENIIERAGYESKRENEDRFTDGQSTGTSAMINCLLLSFLLKRLMRNGASLNLPLVLDESLRIDGDNLKELADTAEKYGFALFGACPNITPAAALAFGRYFSLENYSAEHPYHRRNTILYHGGTEQLLQNGGAS
jgi:hypothetical protein